MSTSTSVKAAARDARSLTESDDDVCLVNERRSSCRSHTHAHTHAHSRSPSLRTHTQVRVRAYTEKLYGYRSVSLSTMASDFGVSERFLDEELARFIALGRLPAKLDSVAGVVTSTREHSRTANFQTLIKDGDVLLSRVQKLTRLASIQ